jgi:riboflavin kinase / FMN adenylyltransferase
MRVFRGVPERVPSPVALTIGNFDGVHLGHQAMLEQLQAAARRLHFPAAVMTFEPHPREFFSPADAPARLTSLREKLDMLRSIGIEQVFVCHFNAAFAAITPQEFIADILHRRLNTRWLLVGDDFRFGAKRHGDVNLLRQAAASLGFELSSMDSVLRSGERVSSTTIRSALSSGDLGLAARMLGRNYSISGRVVHGEKLGRMLGFPTANIQLKRDKAPVSGIFAVRLHGLSDGPLAGVASLGVRPTVSAAGAPVLEVHAFDFDRPIYGRHLRVEFLRRLRGEEKFPSLEALRQQIARDAVQARQYFECLGE